MHRRFIPLTAILFAGACDATRPAAPDLNSASVTASVALGQSASVTESVAPGRCSPTAGCPVALEAFRIALADARERLVPALTRKPAQVRLDHAIEALDCAVSAEDVHQANVALMRAEAVVADVGPGSIGDDVDVMAIDLLLQRGRDLYPRH